ncbi:MAG: DNA methyltransferase [Patescibacteria group bacterium]
MNLYAFELGRKKDLCFAELIAVLGEKALVERNLDTAIFKLEKEQEDRIQNVQDSLGGTIKIVKISKKIDALDEKEFMKFIENHLMDNFQTRSGKIPFSITLLSFKNPKLINIKNLLNFSKKILKSLGLNSRFVNKNFENTRSSTIYKARVIEKGTDINIIRGEDTFFLGEAVTIQNIDFYSERDYNKPKRDAKVGMLPPKLAQVMINLAGPYTKTIYDPFCGTGTVLMEAAIMAKKGMIGSDIDQRMIDYTQENMEWIKTRIKNPVNYDLFCKDARFLIPGDLKIDIDAIVTETYLGEPQSQPPSADKCEKIFRELSNLNLNWLRAAAGILKRSAKIVMCIPAFRKDRGLEYFPKFDEIAKMAGFQILESFIYDREEQIVARNIKVLQKL